MAFPSRRALPWRALRLALGAALALAGCVPDFSVFTIVDDAGARDAGTDAGPGPGLDASPGDAGASDGGPASDAGPPDAGGDFMPTAIDRECTVPWTDLGASPPATCANRAVTTVATPFDSLSIALGRAIDGTITVAYNELDGPDIGRMGTVSFDEDAPGSPTVGPSYEPVSAIGDVVGTDLRIATEAPDHHQIALWYRSDFGSEVQLRTLRGGVLGPVVTLANGVGPSGRVDVAVDSDGRVAVGWHDDASGTNPVRREQPGGAFGMEINLRTDGDSRLIGAGAMSLVAGASGSMHAAFQWSVTLAASAPSYSVSSATTWSSARTLDNRGIANRTSGVGVDLALANGVPVAAYLDWVGGVGEVRLAEVNGPEPTVTTRVMGVVVNDQPGDHPIEIEADANGWLHLLVADASGAGTTSLQYHRQTLVAGALRWVTDTIAVMAAVPEEVYVDMVLGPDRRPHIVFWDPEVGRVRYATVAP